MELVEKNDFLPAKSSLLNGFRKKKKNTENETLHYKAICILWVPTYSKSYDFVTEDSKINRVLSEHEFLCQVIKFPVSGHLPLLEIQNFLVSLVTDP